MEKTILNNKIGIQIVVLLLAVLFVILGSFCAVFNFINIRDSYNGYSYIHVPFDYIGGVIIATGIAMIIISSIKMANYKKMIASLNDKKFEQNFNNIPPVVSNYNPVDAFKDKMVCLQEMRESGMLSDREFQEMRASVIRRDGSRL